MNKMQSIIEGLKNRDETAFEMMYEKYHKLVFFLIMKRIRDFHESEDIMQDIFLKVWNRIETFNPERGSFEAWLTTVTTNHITNYIVRKRDDRIVLYESFEQFADNNVSRESYIDKYSVFEKLLSPKEYDIIVYKIVFGYSLKRISVIMNDKISNIKYYFYKAVKTLNKFSKKNGDKK